MPNKKNNGYPPKCMDKRLLYVPVKCGRCIECRKQKQREWVVRLSEEIKNNKAIFVTLTLSNKSFKELREHSMESENDIATKAVRRFLERIRKKTKKSVKHWIISELGEKRGRMHLHGIIFCEPKLIIQTWQYGYVFIGTYVNEKTIFYITKYMLKVPEQNKNFIGKILASAGIGKNYLTSNQAQRNKYTSGQETNEKYKLRNGKEIPLPTYYRNHIYNERDKEKLWIEKQEKGYRYIMGERIDPDNEQEYNNILQYYQQYGKEIYGDNEKEWDKQKQRERLRKMKLYRQKAVNNKQKSVNK